MDEQVVDNSGQNLEADVANLMSFGNDEVVEEPASNGEAGAEEGQPTPKTGEQTPEPKEEQGADDKIPAQDGKEKEKPTDAPKPSGEPKAEANPNKELTDTLGKLAEKLETIAQPKVETAKPEAPKEEELPSYQFAINPKLVQALASEDDNERAQATSVLVGALGQHIHRNIRQEYDAKLANVVQQMQQQLVPQAVNQMTLTQQGQQLQNDFYTKYPELNNPVLRQVVHAESMKMLQEGKFTGQWTPEFRDALGTRVKTTLAGMGFTGGQPAPAPTPTPTPAPKPPKPVPSGHSGMGPGKKDVADDILALVEL